jgi:aryl-alcohol dehydrogenase-like predicted oxidoreductase
MEEWGQGMNYRYLGKTGLKVSELCLGTMTFGREASEEISHQMLDHFGEVGGNFIDTANVYNLGVSEEMIGRWLKDKDREDFIIASKVFFPMGEGPNDMGLSRKHILAAMESSLRRLGTDYIDLYQVHCWDETTPLEEPLSTLNSLVLSEKARYVGASNYTGWQLQKAIDMSRERGWEPFSCMQPQYNLLCRSTEWEVLPVCWRERLGVIPWSPLRGGWLSGKFRRGMTEPPEGTRLKVDKEKFWAESWSAYNNEHTWTILDTLFAVAEEVGKTPAQVAINWLMQRPGVTAPIIGARTMKQLENNLGACGWSLDNRSMARLNQVSELPLSYPYDFIATSQRK